MIRIIVVEDQKLILKDLCNKILKSYSNLEILDTATNGIDAYEKIISLKPDVVFTDISMPGMDGINLIDKVKATLPNTNFVIISGYKDFEYARNAMKLGVDEYLLKPVLVEDISKVLNSLETKINSKQTEYEKELLENLLNSISPSPSKLDMNFNYDNYYVLLLNYGNYSNSSLNNISITNPHWDSLDFDNLISQFLNEQGRFFISNSSTPNEKIILVMINDDAFFSIKSLNNYLMKIFNKNQLPVTIAYSKKITNPKEIGLQKQIVKTILEHNIVFATPTIINCFEIGLPSYNYRLFFSASIEKKLKLSLSNNDKTLFLNECYKLIDTFKAEKATQFEITTCLKSLFRSLFSKYSFKENIISNIELKLDECISSSSDYNSLKKNSSEILEDFFNFINKYNPNNSTEKIIESSIEYIKINFSSEINVNDIANMFSISPAYFSRIFKKAIGIPPVAYLSKYRIEKACELFKTTNFTVKQISELCGYSDQFYFSKTFKALTGFPPSEYKNNHLKNSI